MCYNFPIKTHRRICKWQKKNRRQRSVSIAEQKYRMMLGCVRSAEKASQENGNGFWHQYLFWGGGVIGAALGEDSENNKNLDDNIEMVSGSPGEKGGDSLEKTDGSSEKEDVSRETADYKNVFVLNLLEEWEKYSGDNVSVSFKTSYVYDYGDRTRIDSEYYNEISEKLSVETKESEKISDGDWITVCGIVGKEEYDGLENAFIEETGKKPKKEYESGKSKYDKKKKKEAEKKENNFRKSAKEVSYEVLMRYPDTYKNKKIKVVVNITEVEPDGIIFPGDMQGTLEGKEAAIYDDREVKEPKLAKGDTITIYGKGNGLTTVKIKQKSGIFSKTVDKYSIPGISIKYMDLQ